MLQQRVPVDAAAVNHARQHLIDAEDAARVVASLTLLSEPTRLRVLYALDQTDELCVGDLALALDASEDAVSYALRILRASGLVASRRNGRVIFYRLAAGFPEPLREHCLRQLVALSRTAPDVG